MTVVKQRTQATATSFMKHLSTQHDSIGLNSKPASKPRGQTHDVIDIRSNKANFDLKDALTSSFNPSDGGARRLPTLLLYDEKGLQLFEQITYLDEYYLTGYEIGLLKKHSSEIASKIPDGSMLMELGSGNLRKVCLLLQAFEDAHKSIDYYALDLSQKELERTLAHVPDFKFVSCHGLLGTYDDGVTWLKQPAIVNRTKCIIHLGSSIGNFDRDDAAKFLQSYADVLKPNDSMVIGLDSCGNPDMIYHAYNDSKGITHEFVLNALTNANNICGGEIFHVPEWHVIGEYVYDDEGGRHQAFISPLKEVTVLGSVVRPHERIQIERSMKYSQVGAENLWRNAGLRKVQTWTRNDEYGLHMLQREELPFSKVPALYAATTLPSLADWRALWYAWDIVTRSMLPRQKLTEKPIKLRNACIFYLGHIPTFLDIQLTKTTGYTSTDPASYYAIFERGIDPDVDNPDKCHDHSEVPKEWPAVEDIVAYQGRVRDRLIEIYHQGVHEIARKVARAIWVSFEHEAMHLETLLYMMLQSDEIMPPPLMGVPNFARMAKKAFEARVSNEWFDIPEQVVTVGMNDPEDGEENVHFGWDNEKPQRKVRVHTFQAKGRPITNEEYASYIYNTKSSKFPASWFCSSPPSHSKNGTCHDNGHQNHIPTTLPPSFFEDKCVRTVYGLIPLRHALDWPVQASYDELAGCAVWMGGRIPTLEEARSIYAFVESQTQIDTGNTLVKKVPAVNGHLVNDGVEETPPEEPTSAAESNLFIDLAGQNVGFKHWHPEPVTSKGTALAGQSSMGGVWEWTSSVLRPHEGFQPTGLYPAYTADFFDGKHNIVLGGSWATHPRIAGRKSFVNWYQRNYPYTWAGARLVRDAQ
ncbi:Ergothioneine biosynthesis protein 1 [Claviceps maximensis]|nr:Ergothioneine biosynthesis protein 1 [Claviceps maximensis]